MGIFVIIVNICAYIWEMFGTCSVYFIVYVLHDVRRISLAMVWIQVPFGNIKNSSDSCFNGSHICCAVSLQHANDDP